MATNKLIFKNAEEAKNAIMDSQKKEIAALYEKWADEIGDKAYYYAMKSTASSVVQERQMKELQKMLKTTGQQVSNEVYSKIKGNMYTIADVVVADNIKWLESFGFSKDGLNAAFNYVPDSVVRNLITGQIYDSGWSLSKRIWGDNEATMRDIYQVMAKGLAENKPIFEIAKDLEKYVRPSAQLPWNLKMADGKRIYKRQVDYNAQRLARTLVQHSYQQSFIATTQKNPFILEYEWLSNGSRVCELCKARNGKRYKKDELEMDHPNGMCTMIPVVANDMVDQLANWFNSPDGTYPDIDEFAGNFGYEAAKGGTVQDFINKYGTSTKNPSAWYHSMTPIQKAEAKILKDASGLGWDEWYEKNVYSGSTDDLIAYKAKIAAKKAKTETIKVFSDTQEKYLTPYGFSPDNMPTNFNDWSYKVSYEQASEILKSMGTSWSDPHPYQQLMKYYNANLTSTNLTSQTVKTAKAASAAKATTVGKSTDATFDAAKWYESVKKNNLREMEKWTDEWLQSISDIEKRGVRKYTSSAYRSMNNYLRGRSSTTDYMDELKACQSALSKASLPKDVITRRGSDYNMLKDLGLGDITPQNKDKVIGAIIQDKAFVSTSPDSHGGFSGDIEYIIKVPKGSQAMYVDPISIYQGERELLINCGGKYSIEDVEFNKWGDIEKIYMTLKNLKS